MGIPQRLYHWMLVWCCSTVLFQKVYKSIFIPNGLPQFYFSKQMLLVLRPYFNFSTCKRCFIHDLHLEDLQFFSSQTDRGINGDESRSSPLHLSSLCKNTKLCTSPQWCNMAFCLLSGQIIYWGSNFTDMHLKIPIIITLCPVIRDRNLKLGFCFILYVYAQYDFWVWVNNDHLYVLS